MNKIEQKGFRKNDIILDGVRYLVGNGYFGYRGTLDEYTKAEMVAFNLNGIYDQMGDLWRESINAYNPLYTFVRIKDVELNPLKLKPLAFKIGVEIEKGRFFRETTYVVKDNEITIVSERFADQKNKELLYAKFQIKVTQPVSADIYTGIDLDVHNLSGNHLELVETIDEVEFFFARARTRELGLPVVVGEASTRNFTAKSEALIQTNKLLRHFKVELEPGKTYTIHKYTGVCHSRPDSYEYLDTLITKAQKIGYERKYAENEAFWKQKWELSKIEIAGDETSETGVNYSIYQLISARPYSDYVSIPSRGISGQSYKGAVSWDTEIFMLQFFLNTDPETARHMIMYRINGLRGAIEKARQYGHSGAFYAWESQESGYDACTDYNLTDAVTGEPIRTYFKERQIHVNGAVVFALVQYLERTDDASVLFAGGMEMVMECARFYMDYLTYNRDTKQYEALSVIGPDEYHEKVDNNAYTNYMIDFVFAQVDLLLDYARSHDSKRIAQFIKDKDWTQDIVKARMMREKLYLPVANEENIVEQFQGYFGLEDISLEDLKKQVGHPNEYLGGESGLATPTKVIKQADVIILMALFPNKFSHVVKKANFAYYEPKTAHGSSLSDSMHALVACDIGKSNFAYPYFMKSVTIDLEGSGKQFSGGIYIGGTHLAAAGGAYMAIVYGFCGLKHHNYLLTCDTRLTSKIKEAKFKVNVKKRTASVRVTNTSATVTWDGSDSD